MDIKSVTPKTIETVFIPFFPDNFAEIKKCRRHNNA